MRVLFHVLAWLPLIVLQALGALAGNLLWFTHAKRRRIGLRNIERCMPELSASEQRRIVRAAIVNEITT
jgi:Kdo2-lipid IVA lauroyltransferase/acyltransferase